MSKPAEILRCSPSLPVSHPVREQSDNGSVNRAACPPTPATILPNFKPSSRDQSVLRKKNPPNSEYFTTEVWLRDDLSVDYCFTGFLPVDIELISLNPEAILTQYGHSLFQDSTSKLFPLLLLSSKRNYSNSNHNWPTDALNMKCKNTFLHCNPLKHTLCPVSMALL